MGKLVNLLKWNRKFILKDQEGNFLLDDKSQPITIWLRIIGDDDLQDSYREARLRSAAKRTSLRNPESKEYRDEIELISEATVENCVDLIKAARANIFTAEAQSNVARSELPKIEEFATDPDAPSLEEQEKFDKAVRDIEDSYQKALEDYVKSRIETLESELKAMDLETLRTEAKLETSNIMALAVFMEEVQDQKTWRAIYSDKDFKEHEFKNIEEFRSTHGFIKDQLRLAYQELELNPDEVKN